MVVQIILQVRDSVGQLAYTWMMRYLWSCLFILLVGCGVISAEINSYPIVTIQQPALTRIPTLTMVSHTVPTKNPTILVSTSSQTETPTLTKTRQAITPSPNLTVLGGKATATPLSSTADIAPPFTPVPFPTLIPINGNRYAQTKEYPDWIWQSDSSVMLLNLENRLDSKWGLTFINVLEKELFVAEKQEDLTPERWWQVADEWILESTITKAVVEPSGRWASIEPVAIQHTDFKTNQKSELPLRGCGYGQVVPDTKYDLYVLREKNYDPDVMTVTLETIDRQTVTILDDPYDTFSTYAHIDWSWDGELLAVTRYGMYEGKFRPILTIYNRNGSIVKSFVDVDNARWSPVTNSQILFSKQEDFVASSACILDIFTREIQCLERHFTQLQKNKINSFQYEWMSDGEHISYIAWADEGYTGGLYKVAVNSEISICLLKNFDIAVNLPEEARVGWGGYLPKAVIEEYSWSPDGNHLAMITSTALWSHDGNSDRLFTFSLGDKAPIYWGRATDFIGWRP